MLDHQVKALEAWKAMGDLQGIFDLATGAGKTITAIHAIVKLSELCQWPRLCDCNSISEPC